MKNGKYMGQSQKKTHSMQTFFKTHVFNRGHL